MLEEMGVENKLDINAAFAHQYAPQPECTALEHPEVTVTHPSLALHPSSAAMHRSHRRAVAADPCLRIPASAAILSYVRFLR